MRHKRTQFSYSGERVKVSKQDWANMFHVRRRLSFTLIQQLEWSGVKYNVGYRLSWVKLRYYASLFRLC
jgi:hypothetical protein